jgi:predicted ATPase
MSLLGGGFYTESMQFKIDNIGKVRNAEIELRGLTVIAGHNNTGKSTFGKALFCAFHHFFDAKNALRGERRRHLKSILSDSFDMFRAGIVPYKKLYGIVTEILESAVHNVRLFDCVKSILERSLGEFDVTANAALNDVCLRIVRSVGIEDEKILQRTLFKYLDCAFESRITHVNYPDHVGKMSLSIQGRRIDITIQGRNIQSEDSVGVVCDAFYINTPFIFDDLSTHRRDRLGARRMYSHKYHLSENLRESSDNVIGEVMVEQHLHAILNIIHSVVDGNFTKNENGGLCFQELGVGVPLDFASISTGIKSFLIIKRLLEMGKIKDRYVLILDEPEIHLHPEWQLKFAELLVLLQKEFSLTILLTTHSPYFINAVETYSQKYGMPDRCTYYLAENDGDWSSVRDVTSDTNPIYRLLSEPFRQLEHERDD